MIPATTETTVMVEPAEPSVVRSSTGDGGLVRRGETATWVLMGPVAAVAEAEAVVTTALSALSTKPVAAAEAVVLVGAERSRLEVVLMAAVGALGFSESTQIWISLIVNSSGAMVAMVALAALAGRDSPEATLEVEVRDQALTEVMAGREEMVVTAVVAEAAAVGSAMASTVTTVR